MASSEAFGERLKTAFGDGYEIQGEIGSGGMATVYLARDLRHERKVAVKVLKPELAAVVGAERFLSEIKVTANLQHPHILPLHDSGDADGLLYYVMPYVEGESLRAKMDREMQLSMEEAVDIARSVAEALDYAHRQGVIHRDIKPANILLHEGRPLVADFGIALAVRAAAGARLTETGLSLGTPQYMSPEQASGDREVDGRSDVYSLASVLYEMLVGEPPHSGPTVQAVIAKLLTDKPRPVEELRETVPRQVAATVHKALAKLPADRFGSAEGMAEALSGRGSAVLVAGDAPQAGVRDGPDRWVSAIPWAITTGLLLMVIAFLFRQDLFRSGPEATFVNVSLPDSLSMVFVGEAWSGIGQTALALSPDGRTLVYVGKGATTTRMYVRTFDRFETRGLPGTDGAVSPFFSPDGLWLGFFSDGRLYRVSLDGESVLPIAEAFGAYGGSWSDGNRIVAATRDARELLITDPNGTNPIRQPIQGLSQPQWLPGGEWFLAACYDGLELCAVSAETVEVRRIMASGRAGDPEGVPLQGTNPRYVEGGYLVFSDPAENVVLGVRFDAENLETLSDPVELFRGVRREVAQGALQLSASSTGDMTFAPGVNSVRGRLVWAGSPGAWDPLPFPPRVYGSFNLSPDGHWLGIHATSETGDAELWLMDLVRQEERKWTRDQATSDAEIGFGVWLPDSDSALVTLSYGDTSELAVVDARRAVGARTLWRGAGTLGAQSITQDRTVLFTVFVPGGRYVSQAKLDTLDDLPPDALEAFPPLVTAPGNETFPRYSPDGRWLAYSSDLAGPVQVFAQGVGTDDAPVNLSGGGGIISRWSPSGDKVYFKRGQKIYRVEQTGDLQNPFSQPEVYLEGNILDVPGPEMNVHPDGIRLLLLEGLGQRTTTQINLVLNWRHLLEERLDGRR